MMKDYICKIVPDNFIVNDIPAEDDRIWVLISIKNVPDNTRSLVAYSMKTGQIRLFHMSQLLIDVNINQ